MVKPLCLHHLISYFTPNKDGSIMDHSILDLISRIHNKKGKKLTTTQTPQNQELDAQLMGELRGYCTDFTRYNILQQIM
jgi:hypothetical protein